MFKKPCPHSLTLKFRIPPKADTRGKLSEVVSQLVSHNQNLPADYIKSAVFSACASAIGKSIKAVDGGGHVHIYPEV